MTSHIKNIINKLKSVRNLQNPFKQDKDFKKKMISNNKIYHKDHDKMK